MVTMCRFRCDSRMCKTSATQWWRISALHCDRPFRDVTAKMNALTTSLLARGFFLLHKPAFSLHAQSCDSRMRYRLGGVFRFWFPTSNWLPRGQSGYPPPEPPFAAVIYFHGFNGLPMDLAPERWD